MQVCRRMLAISKVLSYQESLYRFSLRCQMGHWNPKRCMHMLVVKYYLRSIDRRGGPTSSLGWGNGSRHRNGDARALGRKDDLFRANSVVVVARRGVGEFETLTGTVHRAIRRTRLCAATADLNLNGARFSPRDVILWHCGVLKGWNILIINYFIYGINYFNICIVVAPIALRVSFSAEYPRQIYTFK